MFQFRGWQTSMAAIMLGATTFAGAAEPVPVFDSLADLFAADALARTDIPFERGDLTTVDCRFHEGRRMRRIEVTFTSQEYRGVRCSHDAVVFLPEGEPAAMARDAAAIVLGGDSLNVTDPKLDRVESIVVELGVPLMVIKQALLANQFGARNAGELMSFGDLSFMETGDARENGYYALSRIFTAAATVAGKLPELQAKRFVVSGGSKGGMAAVIACAGDPRIVGAFPTAWNAVDFREGTQLKGERWGWDVKPKPTGPAGEPARKVLALFDSPHGATYRRLFEPAQWGDLLKDKVVIPAVGTNDPLYHLLAGQAAWDALECRKSFVRVPNYPHGGGHRQHVIGWSFTVAAALLGRKMPTARIEARDEGDEVAVYVTARGAEHALRAVLWVADDPTGDYRKAKWEIRQRLENPPDGQATLVTHLPRPASGTTAFFVHLVDAGQTTTAIASSNVVEIGTPVIHELTDGR